ncbi:zinc finger BED domain-containing protein 4-like [Anolis carolinensis]|uniref:zinc finger BED domain-containing protein 4-like n=1 Tax=Anolis carolinensis TaxID=28377 RepID=UPI002F2B1EF7
MKRSAERGSGGASPGSGQATPRTLWGAKKVRVGPIRLERGTMGVGGLDEEAGCSNAESSQPSTRSHLSVGAETSGRSMEHAVVAVLELQVVDSEDLDNPTPPPATDSEEEVVPSNHRLSHAAERVPTTPISLGVGTVAVGRPRSYIWDHFHVHTQRATLAVCRHCGANISRGRDLRHLATSGLSSHMKRHHPSISVGGGAGSPSSGSISTQSSPGEDGGRQTQSTLEDWGMPLARKRTGETLPTPQQITQTVGEMIALDHHPFRLVEQEGFVRLMKRLCPRYKIPSRHTFSRKVIPGLYEGCKERIIQMLRSAMGGHIHFTSDIWSSLGGGHSYLSLTAHWWEKEGSMDTSHRWALLALEVVDRDHKAETICSSLGNMMGEWMRCRAEEMRRGFMVTDAGRNMIKAVESAGFLNVTCMAHLLHNTVKEGLKSPEEQPASTANIALLIERCRKIAGYFHRSIKAARQLRDRQSLEGLPQHKLLQDVSTRWNSTYKMLERMVEQQKAVHGISLTLVAPVSKLVPTKQEWDTISQLVDVLKPFKHATETLSESKALLSQAVPMVLRLRRHLERLGAGRTLDSLAGPLTPPAQEVVRRLSFAVRKRLEPLLSSKVHMLAALCDPRLKYNVCPKDFTVWKAQLVNLVREVFAARVGETGTAAPLPEMPATPSTSASGETDSPWEPAGGCRRVTDLQPRPGNAFFAETVAILACSEDSSLLASAQKVDSAECSVNRYFEEPPEIISCDPLAYWASRDHMWPDLSHVARQFLSCPPTSVQSERVFSLAGDVVTPHRSLLDPQKVEKLVFLKANLPVLNFPDLDFDTDAS